MQSISRRRFIKTGLIFVPTVFSAGLHGAVKMGNVDSEVGDWMTRVKSFSGNYTSLSVVASDQAMKMVKAAGLRSKILRWNLCCGLNLTAASVPLVVTGNTAESNTGFVAGDYTEATGLQGALGKYFLTGFIPSTHWSSVDDCSIGAYIRTNTSDGGNTMGVQDSTSAISYMTISHLGATDYCDLHNATSIIFADSGGIGHYFLTRTASNSIVLYKNGASVANSTTPSGTLPTREMCVYAYNLAGTPSGPTNRLMAGYQITKGMSAADALQFYNAIQRANTILARNV